MRIRSSTVNAPGLDPEERAIAHWCSTLWFTSFQTQCSTMVVNKRNMVMEGISVLFLSIRSDVNQIRRCTSEPNEHTYGMLRQICREFTVEQLIHLVNKVTRRIMLSLRVTWQQAVKEKAIRQHSPSSLRF
jgi:hypothetical protein